MTTPVAAEVDYLFRHGLLRDAAYELQLPSDRSQLHRFALATFEEIAGGGAADALAGELALHAQRAQPAAPAEELVELRKKEVAYLQQAAEYAWQRHDEATALSCYQRIGNLEYAEPAARVSSLVRVASVMRLRAQFERARKALGKADQLSAHLADEGNRARLLHEWGNVKAHEGDYAASEDFYSRALEIYERVQDYRHVGILTGDLGANCHEQRNYPQAIEYYTRAVEMLEKADDAGNLSTMLRNLASAREDMGDFETAIPESKRALAIAQEAGDVRAEMRALGSLARVLRPSGKRQEAINLYKQTIRLAQSHADPESVAVAYKNLGLLLHEQGDLESARQNYERGIDMAREYGLVSLEMALLGNLAILIQAQGDLREATAIYRRTVEVQRKIGNRGGAGIAQGNLSTLYQQQGRIEEALSSFEDALELLKDAGRPEMYAAFLCMRGLLALQVGDFATVDADLAESDPLLSAAAVALLRLQCRDLLALRRRAVKEKASAGAAESLAQVRRTAAGFELNAESDVAKEIEKCAKLVAELEAADSEGRAARIWNGFLPEELQRPLRLALLERIDSAGMHAIRANPALLAAMQAADPE